MNLLAIRNQLKRLADSKATNQGFNDDLDSLINSAYLYVWTLKPWNFATKQAYYSLLPDLTDELTGVSAGVANNKRNVLFTGPIYSLIPELWQGCIFECLGREYKISDVLSNTTIRLEEPFRANTIGPGGQPFILKKREYALPQDCVDVISFNYKDAPIVGALNSSISPLSAKNFEVSNALDNMTSAYATHYVELPPTHIPSGEKLAGAPFLFDVAESNIVAGVIHEFCWAYLVGDKVGPLSESSIIAPTKNAALYDYRIGLYTWNNTPVAAPTYDNTLDIAPNPFEGKRKVLFFNANFNNLTGQRLGLPKWVLVTYRADTGGVPPNAPATQYDNEPFILEDTQYTARIRWSEMLNPANPAYVEVDGQYQTVKFFPRPQAYDAKYNYSAAGAAVAEASEEYYKKIVARYIYKPEELALPTDTPRLPYEMHQLVVYKAMEDLMNKMGNSALAAFYRNRFEQDLGAFERKYIDYVDSSYRPAATWGRGILRGHSYSPIILI